MSDFVEEPMTFTAARDWIANKVNLPTEMDSRAIANNLPGRIRMQAFLSSKVASANVLDALRQQVTDIAAGKIGYTEGRKRMTEFLSKQGYGIPLPGTPVDGSSFPTAATLRVQATCGTSAHWTQRRRPCSSS